MLDGAIADANAALAEQPVTMTDLSPDAQVVLDAYKNASDLMLDGDPDEVERRLGLAAALRAVVYGPDNDFYYITSEDVLSIADELEGQ